MFACETRDCVVAGKLMHKQGLSEETVEPDFRLGILLQLIALAVHLLEDEEEKVWFIPVPFQHLHADCQVGNTSRPEHAALSDPQLHQHRQPKQVKTSSSHPGFFIF